MSDAHRLLAPGPFTADQLRSGDPYELSRGHAIHVAPTGGRGAQKNLVGASVLDTDPQVQQAGVDVGYSPEPGMLRAPDIAVGNVPDRPGWVRGVPPLAVEYVDRGQDESALAEKIRDLIQAGTAQIWVVRLEGTPRVDVHRPGLPAATLGLDDVLEAPGVLANPVPVRALVDRDAAHAATLKNLLQRQGYADLDAVITTSEARGEARGEALALLHVLAARGFAVTSAQRERILTLTDVTVLDRAIACAVTAPSLEDALALIVSP